MAISQARPPATVVHLVPGDDADAVLKRLRSRPRDQVMLVLGRAGSAMTRPVDLKRLALQLREYPADVALVSTDRAVRAIARAEGLICLPSLDGRGPWRRAWELPFRATGQTIGALRNRRLSGRRTAPTPAVLTNFLAGPMLLVALVAAVSWAALYFVLPGVDVVIYQASIPRQVALQAVADPSVHAVNFDGSLIPGRVVEAEISGSLRIATTGSRIEPSARASGRAGLRNLTAGALLVPRGTILATQAGSRYMTAVDVTLPAAAGEAGGEAAGLEVAVAALESGSGGNAPSNSLNRIEGPLQFSLAIATASAMTGGADRQVSYATEADRRELRMRLLSDLEIRGREQLQNGAAPDEIVGVWPPGPLNPTIVESKFDTEGGESVRDLGLRIRARFFATVFRRSDARELVEARLSGRNSDGQAEFQPAEGTVEIAEPALERVAGGRIALNLSGRAMAVQQIDVGEVRSKLLDLSLPEAEAYLRSLPGVSATDLNHWPPFSNRTARLPFRITVRAVAGPPLRT